MIQYEGILDKIAPVFYKLIRYEEYICSNCSLLLEYFENAHVSGFCTAYHPMQNYYYYYYTELELKGYRAVFISLKDKAKLRIYGHWITFCDVIVNLVINNFSFENEHHEPTSFKYLFQAAVGEDTYETIRRNIK